MRNAPLEATAQLENADALTRFSAAIASGTMIDWQAAALELDGALLDQLKQIQSLVLGFGAVSTAAACEHSATDLSAGHLNTGAVSSFEPGSYFAHLRVLECLGHGAYGRVYRAFDEHLQRAVALKVPNAPMQTAARRTELLRECQHMARVDHPNVLKVYGAVAATVQCDDATGSATDGLAYIGFCCELMQGENLEHWLQRQGVSGSGVLGAGELTTIAAELCAGLAALHQCQIVHSDLKPANVLRHSSGRWVIADFGSSQNGAAPEPNSGTPHFMAPEQFDAQPPSVLTDQYALGALMFRLATRRYPFEAETLVELKALLLKDQRPRLLDLRPDLPAHLIAAIERALSINQAQRFRSIGAFAAQLATPTGSAEAPKKPWFAIAAAVALPIFGVLGWQIYGKASRAPALAPELTQPVSTWTRNRAGVAETLLAGARVQPGEALALILELPRETYVYVINEDSVGARFQLFPLAGFALQNPLPAGLNRLPGALASSGNPEGASSGNPDTKAQDWVITSRGGRERFYLIYSDKPLLAFTQLALTQASRQRIATHEHYAANDVDAAVRGVGGVAPQRAPGAELIDSAWLRDLQQANPGLRVSRFEVLNP